MDKKTNVAHQVYLNHKIHTALVTAVYNQAKVGLLASFLCGSILLIYLFQSIHPILLLFTWYGFFILIILLRLILIESFLRTSNPEGHIFLWRNLFILGAFLGGVSWGLVGSPFLLQQTNILDQSLIFIILAGITAGAVPLLSPLRSAALAFLLPALLPIIFHFALKQSDAAFLFIATILIYLVYLIVLSLKMRSIITRSLKLQFENDELVKNLSNAKNQLELSNKKLEQAATHDSLTHVANRSLFEVRFLEALHRAKREQTILGLLYLDLDKFKEVNDLYGHTIGDKVLLIAVSRIKNVLRDQDILSRLGGDELTVIIENARDIECIADIATRICETMARPIKIDHIEIQVYASIGISIYPVDGDDIDTLLRVADRSMYYVKDHGGNKFHFNIDLKEEAQ